MSTATPARSTTPPALIQMSCNLNEGGAVTSHIVEEVRSAALDLADLKYEILKIVGDAYGNN